jgi:hypothetical protein
MRHRNFRNFCSRRARAGVRSLFVLLALALGASSAVAGGSGALCAGAKQPVAADPSLAAPVAAVFGKATFKATDQDCPYPLKVLRYATADVLVVQAGEPGQACHGCGAPLSAYVLRLFNGGLEPVRRFLKFVTLGTFGAAGDISPVEIGGDDGLAIERGGTFQGYTYETVDFFSFHAGRLLSLRAESVQVVSRAGISA